jgi:hypothetical protein
MGVPENLQYPLRERRKMYEHSAASVPINVKTAVDDLVNLHPWTGKDGMMGDSKHTAAEKEAELVHLIGIVSEFDNDVIFRRQEPNHLITPRHITSITNF